MKKYSFVIILFLTGALLLTSCTSSNNTVSAATPESTQIQSLIAEGSLEPINSLEHSFSLSGQVAEILVENGDVVKTGQVIARLADSPEAELALENAREEALSAQQTLNQLQETTDLALAQAQLDLANAKQEYDKARWNQLHENQARGTNEDEINAARAAVTLAKDRVDDAEEKFNDYSETEDSDPLKAAALSELSNARLNLDKAKLNLNYYLNPPNAQELAISTAEVAVAKARYEDAQRKVDQLQNGSDSDELAMAKARLDSANAALANALHQVDMLELKANTNGTIVDLSLQVGQKVTAGEVVVVVADFSKWIIKTNNLTETEVTSIKQGQQVEVVLDALPEKTLQGEVTYINTLFEEIRGDITYTVTIQLTETDPLMRWGMTAAIYFNQ